MFRFPRSLPAGSIPLLGPTKWVSVASRRSPWKLGKRKYFGRREHRFKGGSTFRRTRDLSHMRHMR